MSMNSGYTRFRLRGKPWQRWWGRGRAHTIASEESLTHSPLVLIKNLERPAQSLGVGERQSTHVDSVRYEASNLYAQRALISDRIALRFITGLDIEPII